MNLNLCETIPISQFRREMRTVFRRIDRGEGPFRITQRSGPDIFLMPQTAPDRLLERIISDPEVPDVRDL